MSAWDMARSRQRRVTPTTYRKVGPVGDNANNHVPAACEGCGFHVCSCELQGEPPAPRYVAPHPMPLPSAPERKGYGQTHEGYDIVYYAYSKPGYVAFVNQFSAEPHVVCGLLTQELLDSARRTKCPEELVARKLLVSPEPLSETSNRLTLLSEAEMLSKAQTLAKDVSIRVLSNPNVPLSTWWMLSESFERERPGDPDCQREYFNKRVIRALVERKP